MVTKHCCYGLCSSDSRKFQKDPTNHIFFVPFPKPHIDAAKCRRWIIACKREHFDESKIRKHTYICSKHFIGGNGPTALNPDPVSATQSKIANNRPVRKRLQTESVPVIAAKKMFISDDTTSESETKMISENHTTDVADEEDIEMQITNLFSEENSKYCFVKGCRQNDVRVRGPTSSCTFHPFPMRQTKQYDLWQQFCKRGVPPDNAVICSDHFHVNDIIRIAQTQNRIVSRTLSRFAVPTILKPEKKSSAGRPVIQCIVSKCPSHFSNNQTHYYSFPKANPNGQQSYLEEWRNNRRTIWLTNLGLNHLQEDEIDNAAVCSYHFESGKPSHTTSDRDKDWAPTTFIRSHHDRVKKATDVATKKPLKNATNTIGRSRKERVQRKSQSNDDKSETKLKLINPRSLHPSAAATTHHQSSAYEPDKRPSMPQPRILVKLRILKKLPKTKTSAINELQTGELPVRNKLPIKIPLHVPTQKSSPTEMTYAITMMKLNSQKKVRIQNSNGSSAATAPLKLNGSTLRLSNPPNMHQPMLTQQGRESKCTDGNDKISNETINNNESIVIDLTAEETNDEPPNKNSNSVVIGGNVIIIPRTCTIRKKLPNKNIVNPPHVEVEQSDIIVAVEQPVAVQKNLFTNAGTLRAKFKKIRNDRKQKHLSNVGFYVKKLKTFGRLFKNRSFKYLYLSYRTQQKNERKKKRRLRLCGAVK